MPEIRLFANLREIAGAGRVDVEGQTVAEAMSDAARRFGPEFERGLETSRIWVNGDEAASDQPIAPGDEVVVLPPVSGGSQPAISVPSDITSFIPVLLAAIVVFANTRGQPFWAATLVGVVAIWAFDVGSAFAARGRRFAPLAVVTAAVASTLTAHVLGGAGYGLATAIAVAVGLGWAVAFPEYRDVPSFAPTVMSALLGSLAVASTLLARSSFSPDERAIDVFLVAAIAGVALGSVVSVLPPLPFVDRFTMSAFGAVAGAVIAATLWDLDRVDYFLVGLVIAVGLVAGQGLSSMLRTGSVSLTTRPPGVVPSLDGVILAAAIYFPLIRLVL